MTITNAELERIVAANAKMEACVGMYSQMILASELSCEIGGTAPALAAELLAWRRVVGKHIDPNQIAMAEDINAEEPFDADIVIAMTAAEARELLKAMGECDPTASPPTNNRDRLRPRRNR
jgi:hypothetical protein